MEDQKTRENTDDQALVSQETRVIKFRDDYLPMSLVDGIPYVALKPIVDAIGVDWPSQYKRLKRDEILNEEARLVVMGSGQDNKLREMIALPLDFLHGWLFGITESRVKDPDIAQKLKQYRKECFRVLWREFSQQSTNTVPSSALVQVREEALALVQFAEEHLALTERVDHIIIDTRQAHARLDKAAEVVAGMNKRLTAVERRVLPYECISIEQATDISTTVKALAELMTRSIVAQPGQKVPNYFQGVFSELYRRFGASKYTLIRQKDYQTVLQFLDDWRMAVVGGSLLPPSAEE